MLRYFRPFAPALLGVAAMSCMRYSEMPTGNALLPGRDVRISLNSQGSTELASRLGPSVRTLYGKLRSSDSTSVTLALARTTLADGTDAPWSGEVVTIPTSDITVTEERKVDAAKTTGLLVLVSGGIIGLTLALGHGGSSTGANSVQGSGAK